MELTQVEQKGKRAYWRAFGIWCFASLVASIVYALHPSISIAGKVIIVVGLVCSIYFLYRASDPARYTAGALALLGLMSNITATCAVFDPKTQIQGLLAIAIAVPCGLVWHAFLISDNVGAYLKRLQRLREKEWSDEGECQP